MARPHRVVRRKKHGPAAKARPWKSGARREATQREMWLLGAEKRQGAHGDQEGQGKR